jgi:hypothetical protein
MSLPIMSWYVMLFPSVVVIGTNAELGVFYDCTLLAVRTCSSCNNRDPKDLRDVENGLARCDHTKRHDP